MNKKEYVYINREKVEEINEKNSEELVEVNYNRMMNEYYKIFKTNKMDQINLILEYYYELRDMHTKENYVKMEAKDALLCFKDEGYLEEDTYRIDKKILDNCKEEKGKVFTLKR